MTPTHVDPGDRLAGYYDPPRPCVIITSFRARGGPRNVAVEYLDDGSRAVVPCPRRLRRADVCGTQPHTPRAPKLISDNTQHAHGMETA